MFDPSHAPKRYGWLEGLTNRAVNCIVQIGEMNHLEFESKEDFKGYVEKMGVDNLRRYRNLGKKTYREILNWLEIPSAGEPLVICPCCHRPLTRLELYRAIFSFPNIK